MHHVLVFDICSLSPMTSRGWLEAEGTARSEQLHFTASRTCRADALISEGPLWASEVWQFDSSMLVYNEIKLFWLLAACVCQYVIAETAHFLNIKEVTVGCGALGARFDVMKPDVAIAFLLTDGSQWQWNDPTTGCMPFGWAIGTSSAPGEDSSMPWRTKKDINSDAIMLQCVLAILI